MTKHHKSQEAAAASTSKRRVTALDVAKRAGVSRSAVSRTFTPGAYVSEEMRNKVEKAVKELGYRVNYLARGVTKQRSDLVGIVAADLDNPFRTKQVEHLTAALLEYSYRPILLLVDRHHNTGQLVDQMLHYMVSGIVVTSDAPSTEICEECYKNQVPLVLVNKGPVGFHVDRVQCDNDKGGQLAAEELFRAGCRNPAVVKPGPISFSIEQRVASFIDWWRQKEIAPKVVTTSSQTYEGGRLAANTLLGDHDKPDGVFCAADAMALGFLDESRYGFGVKVPRDIKLVGFDNVPQAAWSSYDLTTIHHPPNELARAALEFLVKRIGRPEQKPGLKIVDVELVSRGSTSNKD